MSYVGRQSPRLGCTPTRASRKRGADQPPDRARCHFPGRAHGVPTASPAEPDGPTCVGPDMDFDDGRRTLRFVPPVTQLGRETGNALVFKLDQLVEASQRRARNAKCKRMVGANFVMLLPALLQLPCR